MPNAQDRRGQPRAPLTGSAVAFIGDERVDCRTLDISASGIALATPVPRNAGQFLRVNFCLLPHGGVPKWYDADGVVVRVDDRSGAVVLGVQFVVIDDRAARDVHAYVAEALQRQRGGAANEPRMPDAMHPPKVTGEYTPAGRRRTGEFTPPHGTAVPSAAESSTRGRVGEFTPPHGTQVPSAAESSTRGRVEFTPPHGTAVPSASESSTRGRLAEFTPPHGTPVPGAVEPPRRTAEYGTVPGTSEPAAAPRRSGTVPPAARSRSGVPETSVRKAEPEPEPVPAAASKQELDRLFRAALKDVAGDGGGRKDKRRK